jgi:tetratricopeptide (TPR) repeat protein
MPTLPLIVPLVLLLAPNSALMPGASGPAASPTPNHGELQKQSARAKELMAAERYAEAIPLYRALVQALPDNAGLRLNLGMALHLSGQDEEAVPHLEQALRQNPHALPAALFLGAAFLRTGHPDRALGPLQTAVKLDPAHLEARALLSDAFLAVSEFARALPHLRRLTELDPESARAWSGLGSAYEALAAQAFDDLVSREPEGAYTAALAARARREQGQEEVAFQLYRDALRLAPTLRGLHSALADIYRATGHADWAAVEDERERALPRLSCATPTPECELAQGKPQAALAATLKVGSPETLFWRVRAYTALAEEAFAALSRLRPSPESYERTARLLARGRRHAEAAAAWRQAIALAPEDLELKLGLAVSLRASRDLAGAQAVLEEIVGRAPDLPEASALLGDVLVEQQDPERAIPLLETALHADDAEYVHGTLGRAYALAGRPAEAIPHLKQALAVDVDGSLHYQLARAYQASGQAEAARSAMADYEEFRKAAQSARDASGPAITPP